MGNRPARTASTSDRLGGLETTDRNSALMAANGQMTKLLDAEESTIAKRPARKLGKGSKAQRVRINSRSEQIQDPSWLIYVNRRELYEEQQEGRRRTNLKSFKRKLKFGLKSGPNSAQPDDTLNQAYRRLVPAIPVASSNSPMKSILKQPNPNVAVPSDPPERSSPTSKPEESNRTQVSAKSKQRRAKQLASKEKALQQSALDVAQSVHDTRNVIAKPVCSAGEPKLSSGWRRSTLLAKTLGHLDEIRGNQRPVFKPNKISSGSNEGHESNMRFAEIVRQMIRKKSLVVDDEQSDDKKSSAQERDEAMIKIHWPSVEKPSSNIQSDYRSSSLIVSTEKNLGGSPKRSSLRSREGNRWRQVADNRCSPNRTSCATSSRQLKLELKNQQVLQQLRRKSNEQQLEDTTDDILAKSDQAQGHVKDWRRLTSKLALLTGHRHQQSASQGAPCRHRHLGDDLSQRERRISAGGGSIQPLRLTVSNEGSSRRALWTSSGPQLDTTVEGGQMYDDDGKPRKLSSSSMVVDGSRLHPDGFKLDSPMLSVASSTNPRRSSDSEAQRCHLLAPELKGSMAERRHRNSNESGEGSNGSGPVVVNRNDLVQLLQVTCCDEQAGPRAVRSRSQPGSGRGSIVKATRLSLQLNTSNSVDTSSLVDAILANKDKASGQGHAASNELLSGGTCGVDSQTVTSSREWQTVSQLGSKVTISLDVPRPRDGQVPRQPKVIESEGSKLKAADLLADDNDVVDAQDEADLAKLEAWKDESYLESAQEDDRTVEEPLMDPELIGDAIEIFLRQAMQAGQCDEDSSTRSNESRLNLGPMKASSSSSLQQQFQSSTGCQ